jgi:hypothetical protein
MPEIMVIEALNLHALTCAVDSITQAQRQFSLASAFVAASEDDNRFKNKLAQIEIDAFNARSANA